jgi:FMN-dependent NADH-azoreductase
MPSLLVIESSPRGDYSISRALTAKFVAKWSETHSGGTVVTRDLSKTDLPFVDLPWIAGAYTPVEQHSPEMTKALSVSNTLIPELQAADHIVLGTSMYNFSLPAILKAYIDHVVRIGVTVSASYEGQLKGKKLTVILASGGIYTPGSPTEGYNLETGYLKAIFGFIGITDVTIVLAGGSSAVSQGKTSQADLVASFTPEVEAAAAA